jgi:hypothetical protein
MPAFTNESLVRLRFHLPDTTLVPTELVEAGIDDAHTVLVRSLAPDVNQITPDADLVIGETLLAGANLLRSLASNETFAQKRMTIGGQQIQEGARFQSLLQMADISEREAWYVLERFLAPHAPRELASATDTQPILGEN